MVKTLTIDGRPVTFRATAAVPRLYRIKFRRDIMQDMGEIQKALKQAEESDSPESNIPPRLLEMFEDVAFIMARHGDPENTPSTPEEWLDQFNTFSIYEIFPHILELWDLNTETQSRPKKKNKAQGPGTDHADFPPAVRSAWNQSAGPGAPNCRYGQRHVYGTAK